MGGLLEHFLGDDDAVPGGPGAGAVGQPEGGRPPGREALPLDDQLGRSGVPAGMAGLFDQRLKAGLPGLDGLRGHGFSGGWGWLLLGI